MAYRHYSLTVEKIFHEGIWIAPEQKLTYSPADLPSLELTYRDCARRVNSVGRLLEKLGVRRGTKPWDMGTRVSIIDWNSIRYQELLFAVPMYGAVAHTVNIRESPKTQVYMMSVTEPEVLFINTSFISLLDEVFKEVKTIKNVVIMDDKITCTGKGDLPEIKCPAGVKIYEYEDQLKSVGETVYDWPELDENVVATTFFTSGTTGMPKGVYHTHRQIFLQSLQLMAAYSQPPLRIINPDISVNIVPYFHIVGWGQPYWCFWQGIEMVFPGRYEWEHIARLILQLKPKAEQREGKVFSQGVPTMLNLLIQQFKKMGVDKIEGFTFEYGGAALPLALYKDCKRMGIVVGPGYGPTETGMTGISRPIFIPRMWMKMGWDPEKMTDHFVKNNSLGVPIPGASVKVVKENGKELPHDGKSRGKLLIFGPSITKEYYKNPKATEKAWRFDYFDMDDLCVIDEFGSINFADRTKDVIKSGGEWIESSRLEVFIAEHPAVSEVCVIGVPHPKWGERAVAIVTLKPDSGITEHDLLDHLRKNFVETGEIPKWWVPDRIIIESSELPKTGTGKINKSMMREKYKNIKLE
ncbi:MAG: AMP-binding protein [Deltaproteobacteria bacterium]|nr:AMP-binding protein [Deltaproteobacteria bacterium]